MSSPIIPIPAEELMTNQPGILDEVIREAETRLQAQLQTAIAADSRAMVIASVQAAASGALIVAGAQDDITGLAEAAAYVAGAVLFAGAAAGAWAARPVTFGFAGSNPSDWCEAVATKENIDFCRAHYATHLDEYLRCNARLMSRSASTTRLSLALLVAAPLFAGLTLAIGSVW